MKDKTRRHGISLARLTITVGSVVVVLLGYYLTKEVLLSLSIQQRVGLVNFIDRILAAIFQSWYVGDITWAQCWSIIAVLIACFLMVIYYIVGDIVEKQNRSN